ncbi:MAG: DUF1566 domain-containing protein [Proteobacteria bacterium]|nr:MAG: DUF1566 domain-containing protein [Pseudomonadota bacterium]
MKSKLLTILLTAIFSPVIAQTNLIFKSGFEFEPKLNDTGITWAGEYPSGSNVDCSNSIITSPQDCSTGRDIAHNDPTDGHAGFSFTKLDIAGVPLEDQSVDYQTTPWACVKDNITGLVWEIKTTTGIHNKDNTYRWGGITALGRDHPNSQGTYYDDWNDLVQGSNDEALCGFDDWRVPTVSELSSIANKGTFNPAIDTSYFPNTASSRFWSSSPATKYLGFAWVLSFDSGFDGSAFRYYDHRVRLVHSVQ